LLDNIKMDFDEVDWRGMDCVGLAQNRDLSRVLLSAVMNIRISIECLEVLKCLHNRWPLE
jgi:hypothetical protein